MLGPPDSAPRVSQPVIASRTPQAPSLVPSPRDVNVAERTNSPRSALLSFRPFRMPGRWLRHAAPGLQVAAGRGDEVRVSIPACDG